MNQKTFSASSIQSLDILVNAFIGRQVVDGRTVIRTVLFMQTFVSGGNFYTTIIYAEVAQSN